MNNRAGTPALFVFRPFGLQNFSSPNKLPFLEQLVVRCRGRRLRRPVRKFDLDGQIFCKFSYDINDFGASSPKIVSGRRGRRPLQYRTKLPDKRELADWCKACRKAYLQIYSVGKAVNSVTFLSIKMYFFTIKMIKM